MRFGKRLAELTKGRSHEPYVSYKELKHTISQLSSLIGGCGSDDDNGASSLDEGPALPTVTLTSGCSAGSRSCRQPLNARCPLVDAHQHEFFNRLQADIAQARSHVQSSVTALEAQIGDWQTSAILAGVLFTPVQLDEISSNLPFAMQDHQLLVEWLLGLRPAENKAVNSKRLLDKYCAFARNLNGLLRYIEVNLTAIRKIFKKFQKKVPADYHIQNISDYKAHHDLCMPAMQDVLVASVHIHKFVLHVLAQDLGSFGDLSEIVPMCELGPETLVMLSWLRGPAALDDILAASPSDIDVFAKPSVADAGGTSIVRKSTDPPHGMACRSSSSAAPAEPPGQQQQQPLQSQSMSALDMFRGPQQTQHNQQASGISSSASTSKLRISLLGMPAPGNSAGGRGNSSKGRQQELDGAAFGRGRRGGRGSGQKGRGGRKNTQSGQGAGKRGLQAAPEPAPAAAAAAAAAAATATAAQPPYFAGFPAFVGKAGGYKGAQCTAACHGGWGAAGYSGKGIIGAGAAGATAMDPQWLAAMMPTVWAQGIIPLCGMAPPRPG